MERKKTITISRDTKFYGHMLNETVDPLERDFYFGESWVKTENWLGAIPVKHWKKWGPNSPFPSIIDIKQGHRVFYTLKSPYDQLGRIVDGGGPNWLNCMIDFEKWESIATGMIGGQFIDYIDEQSALLDNYYQRESSYGTRLINNKCYGPLVEDEGGCYGDMGQWSGNTHSAHGGIHNIFWDPHHRYYKKNYEYEMKNAEFEAIQYLQKEKNFFI